MRSSQYSHMKLLKYCDLSGSLDDCVFKRLIDDQCFLSDDKNSTTAIFAMTCNGPANIYCCTKLRHLRATRVDLSAFLCDIASQNLWILCGFFHALLHSFSTYNGFGGEFLVSVAPTTHPLHYMITECHYLPALQYYLLMDYNKQ